MKKVLFFFAFSLFICASYASAQPRPAETSNVSTSSKTAALSSFEARYDGGMFGYNEKIKGTVKLDEENERMVFYGKDNKEVFAISFESILVISPSSRKVQSGAGRTVGAIPVPGAGLGGGLFKKQKNHMIIQYRDPDVALSGSATFLIDTDELMISAIHSIGEKAKLTKRGDAYYRPRESMKSDI